MSANNTITQLPEALCATAGGTMDIHRRDENNVSLRWRPMHRLWILPAIVILVSPLMILLQAVLPQHYLMITIGTLSPIIGFLMLLASWIISAGATYLKLDKTQKKLQINKRAYKKRIECQIDQVDYMELITHIPEEEQQKKHEQRLYMRLDIILCEAAAVQWTKRPISRLTLLHHADLKKIETWADQLKNELGCDLRRIDLTETPNTDLVET